jgi:hypothetical protein
LALILSQLRPLIFVVHVAPPNKTTVNYRRAHPTKTKALLDVVKQVLSLPPQSEPVPLIDSQDSYQTVPSKNDMIIESYQLVPPTLNTTARSVPALENQIVRQGIAYNES